MNSRYRLVDYTILYGDIENMLLSCVKGKFSTQFVVQNALIHDKMDWILIRIIHQWWRMKN